MKALIAITVVGMLAISFLPALSAGGEERPGDIERAALGKVDFVVGDWAGEGWSLTPSGQRERFWVREFFHYRGNKDLMDMEGRFGGIGSDGKNLPETEYALGILYYDRANGQYRMWHYGDNGSLINVAMEIDVPGRSFSYQRKSASGDPARFGLHVGSDGIWVSRLEVLKPDKTWVTVMEFRMKRVK